MPEFMESTQLLSCRQFGICSGSSTDQILIKLVNKMRYMLSQDRSEFLTLAALDIKKAFDCANHKLLVTKFTQKFNFTLYPQHPF